MTTQQIKVAGYVRVSSKQQIKKKTSKGFEEKFSLPIQREAIKKFCQDNHYTLTEIYEDAGISGGSVKKRHGLQRCLKDGISGKFNMLVVYRLSRFGRNARELLDNYNELQQAGIELRSISEGLDFSNRYGKAILGILAIVAELENDIRRETLLEARIATAQDHRPASGKGPIGRTFDESTGRWELDWSIVPHIQWAAQEYLSGKSIWQVREALRERGVNWSETTLLRTLSGRCGTTWKVKFADEELIEYTNIEPILDENTIRKINEQVEFNRTNNRKDTTHYVLSGYLFCGRCGRYLTGSTLVRGGRVFSYYNHPSTKKTGCHITPLNLEETDKSVFGTILGLIEDWPNFEKAISESLPDDNYRETLHSNIKKIEGQIGDIDKELDNISRAIAKGSRPETHIKMEKELYERKIMLQQQFENYREQLDGLPDPEEVVRQAKAIRSELVKKYLDNPDRVKEMSYEEKRLLLSWLFGGKDEMGRRFGIYVTAEGKGNDKLIKMRYHGKVGEFKDDNDVKLHEKDDKYKTSFTSSKK